MYSILSSHSYLHTDFSKFDRNVVWFFTIWAESLFFLLHFFPLWLRFLSASSIFGLKLSTRAQLLLLFIRFYLFDARHFSCTCNWAGVRPLVVNDFFRCFSYLWLSFCVHADNLRRHFCCIFATVLTAFIEPTASIEMIDISSPWDYAAASLANNSWRFLFPFFFLTRTCWRISLDQFLFSSLNFLFSLIS